MRFYAIPKSEYRLGVDSVDSSPNKGNLIVTDFNIFNIANGWMKMLTLLKEASFSKKKTFAALNLFPTPSLVIIKRKK